MPSTSQKQHNLMEGVAHDPKFAAKVGISQKVGKDFVDADKGKSFAEGGSVSSDNQAPDDFASRATQSASPSENVEDRRTNDPSVSLYGFKGLKGGSQNLEGPNATDRYRNFADGGFVNTGVAPPSTMGVSSAYPAPPGHRAQGRRNYGKKVP